MATIERALLIGLLSAAAVTVAARTSCEVGRILSKVQNVLTLAESRGQGGPNVTTERIKACR
jgi:Flp pilus assembly pilin Flp